MRVYVDEISGYCVLCRHLARGLAAPTKSGKEIVILLLVEERPEILNGREAMSVWILICMWTVKSCYAQRCTWYAALRLAVILYLFLDSTSF
jgi:hypothetical protein